MDALVAVALQEVAAEGKQGCSLPTLWGWLKDPSGSHLDSATKQAVWKLLLSSSCLSFQDMELRPLASTTPSIQAFHDAERLDICIIASEELRESFLGAYDVRHCDSKLSAEQKRILERVGRARAVGITQYQIGKEFGMTGNKLFYIIKNLESRGLLVRQSSIYRGERPIATNLIHLKRFAKDVKLGFQQRFEIQKAAMENENKAPVAGTSQEKWVKGVLINDDLPALKAICKKLEEADNNLLVISDLKVSLGYRLKKGHREWRRILSRLVGAGIVEAFEAKVENKVLPCIRLLKPFDVKAFSSKENSMSNTDELGMELNFRGARRGQITEQVAELSINRQIYDFIKQGASDGVAVTEIFTYLGINNRKNYYRLSDMIPKHGLQLKVENHKRATQYRVCLPADLPSAQPDTADMESSKSPFKASANLSIVRGSPMMDKGTSLATEASEHLTKDPPLEVEVVCADPGEGGLSVAAGFELVPYGEGEKLEASEQDVIPINFAAPAVPANESMPIALSKSSQRTVALSSAHTQREIWIMERLEREKYILRSELHRWLEELECRTNTILDRKTVIRNLQKLQKQGRCKSISVSLPGVSNYGQIRTVDVVMLPSLEVNPELLSEIYERQRAFDLQIRTQSLNRRRKSKDDANLPTVSGLKRMPKTEVVDKGGTLQDNGFIPAKLVRCRMLHRFLWLYVSGHNDGSSLTEDSDMSLTQAGESCSSVFSLLAAVQSMPLELFLQVIGSAKHIKGLSECCRRGMRLSDLPTRESEALLDINASGRVAWLVDILRRLKLLRIVMIPDAIDSASLMGPQAGVAYALEYKPYIDEPALEPPSSISAHILNHGPAPRHYFDLSSKENLEDYWKTLEYFFRGSSSAAARRTFPGSTVPELFGPRSWSSLRVMTMDQRIQLQKRIRVHDNKRLHYEECVQIARELNLSLDQVLGASYEKNQKMKMQQICNPVNDTSNPSSSPQINIALGKRHATSSDGVLGDVSLEIMKVQLHSTRGMEGSVQQNIGEYGESPEASKRPKMSLGESDAKEDIDASFAPEITVVRKFRPLRKKKFAWKDSIDRIVIACYTRQRALLGARYNRVDWNSIPGLPAPPDTCRRRIAYLRLIPTLRKAIMTLCNLLGTRYTKYLCSQSGSGNLWDGEAQRPTSHQSLRRDSSADGFSVSTSNNYSWDDFKDPVLSSAIDEIIRCKHASRSLSSKKVGEHLPGDRRSLKGGFQSFPEFIKGDEGEARLAFASCSDPCVDGGQMDKTTATEEMIWQKATGENLALGTRHNVSVRARPNRSNVRKSLQRPTTLKNVSSADLVQKSVGAAVAVELIKLVFLNSAVESEVSETLVDALQRCKESDIFTAFRFLKDQGMVACGESGQAFVLSPKFYRNSSSSPFPPSICDEAKSSDAWLKDKRPQLDQGWVTLKSDQEWGELFHLFALVSAGQLSLAPFLPEKGIGEKNQDEVVRKRKRDAYFVEEEPGVTKMKIRGAFEKGGLGVRRERGFPGIEVKARTSTMSLESMIVLESAEPICLEHPSQSDFSLSEACKSLEPLPLAGDFVDMFNEDMDGSSQSRSLVDILEGKDHDIPELDDKMQVPDLERACAALLRAGEEGLKVEEGMGEVKSLDGSIVLEESYAKALHTFGLAREVMAFDHVRLIAPPHNERFFLHTAKPGEDHAVEMVPVLPWLEASGKENAFMRKSLNRRVLGIVMLHPGILEESIVEQLDVLNPSSCQKLLQLMVLDGYLFVKTRVENGLAAMPKLLQRLASQRDCENQHCTSRRHYFANPERSDLL